MSRRPRCRTCPAPSLEVPVLILDGGLTAGKRVLACALISDPARQARTVVGSALAVAQRVDEHTQLVTVLEDDAARAVRLLGELCACDAWG